MVAPTIEEHPENACVTSGSTVSFSVAATSRDLSYQWFSSTRDESPIMLVNIVGGVSGATTSQLTITGATATKSYYVVVLNAAGDINSNPATLTIGEFVRTYMHEYFVCVYCVPAMKHQLFNMYI